jgi:hypothetical protein
MKKFLVSLLVLLAFTVYFKPTAAYTGGIMTGLKEPKKIELKSFIPDIWGIFGKAGDGRTIWIPWDAIAYIEESS